jgi:hypothetical protein
MTKYIGKPPEHPRESIMTPYIVGAPTCEEVAKASPKKGKTIMDHLGQTWGEATAGIVVRHK